MPDAFGSNNFVLQPVKLSGVSEKIMNTMFKFC